MSKKILDFAICVLKSTKMRQKSGQKSTFFRNMSGETKYIVNENGEVLQEILPSETFYVKKNKADLQWTDTKVLKMRFVKASYTGFSYAVTKYSLFREIFRYITYLDNVLMFRNGRVMKLSNMAKACSLKYRSIQRQLKLMEEEDIIQKMELGGQMCYVVNPWICCRGVRINSVVYDRFESSRWREESLQDYGEVKEWG